MRNGLTFYGVPELSSRRLFDNADSLFNMFSSSLAPWEKTEAAAVWAAPAVDVEETENAYLFKFDLPGMTEKDVSITVMDRELHVKGERSKEKEEKTDRSYRNERFFGKFERSFTLPKEANAEKTVAEFKDGVLSVQVAKAIATQPRTIAIKSPGNKEL